MYVHQAAAAIEKFELTSYQGWGYRLVYFWKPTKLINDRKQGYLIPLSKDITLTPGGLLHEGFYTYITNDPTLSSGATAIFILPL